MSTKLKAHTSVFTMAARGKDVSVEVAPLRSLDDFLLESARFQVPNFKDLDKWGNRVVQNLLYYQSNYFLTALICFALVGCLHPAKMMAGVVAVVIAFGLVSLASNAQPAVAQFKKSHPVVCLLVSLTGAYFLLYMLSSLLVFLLGIFLPLSVIFVHASLRLRNIKNKLINKMEQIGIAKTTPMGVLLDALGLELEVIS